MVETKTRTGPKPTQRGSRLGPKESHESEETAAAKADHEPPGAVTATLLLPAAECFRKENGRGGANPTSYIYVFDAQTHPHWWQLAAQTYINIYII